MADRVMTSTRLLAASLAAVVFISIVFVVWPGLDLDVARRFVSAGGGFAGDTPLGRGARRVCGTLPLFVMIGFGVLYGLRRFGGVRIWAPNGAGLVMMALSLALGPGLLVNTILKDHSHRPRPVQVTDFGGPYAFRPFYALDGGCDRNCSFVSGEGSAAFWTLAPALLAAPPVRTAAVAGALVFGVATSLLRMAFGGHFLSDSLFAGLFSWLVIVVCWRAVSAVSGDAPGGYRA